MLSRLIRNPVFARAALLLALLALAFALWKMPRAQTPMGGAHSVEVVTRAPGLAAAEVERQLTRVIELAVKGVPDVRFLSSTSRAGESRVRLNFRALEPEIFADRLGELRWAVQGAALQLPELVQAPEVVDVSDSGPLPSVEVLVIGSRDSDVGPWSSAQSIAERLETLTHVDRVLRTGMRGELVEIRFDPDKLAKVGLSAAYLSDQLKVQLREQAAGALDIAEDRWQLRVSAQSLEPQALARLPLSLSSGKSIALGDVAQIVRGEAPPTREVRIDGRPAVLLSVFRKSDANALDVVDAVAAALPVSSDLPAGTALVLLDDRARDVRGVFDALTLQVLPAALIALLVISLFYGARLTLLIMLAVPVAAGIALLPWLSGGEALTPGLLIAHVCGAVLLLDASLSVADMLRRRQLYGADTAKAALDAERLAARPLLLAWICFAAAALLPMWWPDGPGAGGSQVARALLALLAAGLVYAGLLLPAQMVAVDMSPDRASRVQQVREWLLFRLRRRYRRLLLVLLRHRLVPIISGIVLLLVCLLLLSTGRIGVALGESGVRQSFYINLELPPASRLEQTLSVADEVERVVRALLPPGSVREVVTYAGQRRTEFGALLGARHGQIEVSLRPESSSPLSAHAAMALVKPRLDFIAGARNIAVQAIEGGLPAARPISVTVRGGDPVRVREGADALVSILRALTGVVDITDDDDLDESAELHLSLKPDALLKAGLTAPALLRELRLLGSGELIARVRENTSLIDVTVRGKAIEFEDIDAFLDRPLHLADGRSVALRELFDVSEDRGRSVIRHYDLQRSITVQADVDRTRVNAFAIDRVIRDWWAADYAARFPDLEVETTGAFGEVNRHMTALFSLFVLGIGFVYLLLVSHAGDYRQPLLAFCAMPLAAVALLGGLYASGQLIGTQTGFAGTVFLGLAVHGMVALLVGTRQRLDRGIGVARANLYAAEVRLLPTLVLCTATTLAMLPLASGLAGFAPTWTSLGATFAWGMPLLAVLMLCVAPALCTLQEAHERAEQAKSSSAEKKSRGGLFARWRSGSEPDVKRRDDLPADPKVRRLYEQGMDYLRANDQLMALRSFEDGLKSAPNVISLLGGAVQALLQYLHANWDEGFYGRAARHLNHWRQLAPESPRPSELMRALEEVRERGAAAVLPLRSRSRSAVPQAASGGGWLGPMRLSPTVQRPWRLPAPHAQDADADKAKRRPLFDRDLPGILRALGLALRNLVRQRRRTTAALAAIGFGAIALVLAGGFIEWVLWATRESAIYGQLGHIQIVRQDYFVKGSADPQAFLQKEEVPEALAGVPHVRQLAPRLAFSGLISFGDLSVPYLAQGVVPDLEAPISVDYRIVSGKGLTTRDAREVILGSGLAATLGVKPGGRVVLMASSQGGGFNAVELTVRGLFSTSNQALNEVALRLPLSVAQELTRDEHAVHTWVVLLDDTAHTDSALAAINNRLDPSLQAVPWYQLSDFYNKTSELFARQMMVLRLMIVIIILLSISNSLMMNVMERTGEIGTLQALGTRRRSILYLFSMEALMLGLLGGGLGVLLGSLIGVVASAIGIPMPPAPGMDKGFVAEIMVTPPLALTTFILTVGATFVSGLYPAWKASRLIIVDALRHNR